MRIWLSLAALCLFSPPALAFDCAKATTPVEQAICADDNLKRADDELGTSYAEVKALSSAGERKMLARAQKRWIAERESACATPGDGQTDCIRLMIDARLKLFAGTPESGPRLIAIEHSYYSETGGAHGNGGSDNYHVDPQSGRDYRIGDFFSEVAADQIRRECRDQIIARKRALPDNGGYDPATDNSFSDQVIAEHVATLAAWSFRASEARIRFDSYAIGAYAEGQYECLFPIQDLKSLALPGAPLPE